MPIPDFQSIMLPLLESVSDGKSHGVSELISVLAERFKLTDEERKELLPSGKEPRFSNRVRWARKFLQESRLVDVPGRGATIITERGMKILKQKPDRIDMGYLTQFPEYVAFRQKKSPIEDEDEKNIKPAQKGLKIFDGESPDEVIEQHITSLRTHLKKELIQLVLSLDPSDFEQLVVDIVLAMGYGGSRKDAGMAIGKSGDGGVDGIVNEDRLGLDKIYLQAKRWKSGKVGRPDVQSFSGSLDDKQAKKGVFITTSSFTPEAREYVRKIEKRIALIDGDLLTDLMIEHSIGASVASTYSIYRLDRDYFEKD